MSKDPKDEAVSNNGDLGGERRVLGNREMKFNRQREKMAQEKKELSRRDFFRSLLAMGISAPLALQLMMSLGTRQRAEFMAWAQSYGRPMTYAELGRLIDAAAWDDVVRAVRFQPASYIVYQASDGSIQAKNGNTGQVKFSGTDAASLLKDPEGLDLWDRIPAQQCDCPPFVWVLRDVYGEVPLDAL